MVKPESGIVKEEKRLRKQKPPALKIEKPQPDSAGDALKDHLTIVDRRKSIVRCPSKVSARDLLSEDSVSKDGKDCSVKR